MIHYVSTSRFASTVGRLLSGARVLRRTLRPLSYEELFFESAGPIGHYIFTDFDRLSRYEMEAVGSFVQALRKVAPGARILNDPTRVLERTPLLVALSAAGINDFTAVRLDTGARPARFPCFIRAEDGYGGPETAILKDEAEFESALAALTARGLPLRGRIAVGFAAEPSADGLYRKYGVFNIGGTIIPQHLLTSEDWVIKSRRSRRGLEEAAEELEFIRQNPHREVVARAFAIAGLDFGRADYGIVGGKVQVYEINTNPSFPNFAKTDLRVERRELIHDQVIAAFRALDAPVAGRGRIRFRPTRPRAHDLHWPRLKLPLSLARRFGDLFRR